LSGSFDAIDSTDWKDKTERDISSLSVRANYFRNKAEQKEDGCEIIIHMLQDSFSDFNLYDSTDEEANFLAHEEAVFDCSYLTEDFSNGIEGLFEKNGSASQAIEWDNIIS